MEKSKVYFTNLRTKPGMNGLEQIGKTYYQGRY
jgi:hypothetical protein